MRRPIPIGVEFYKEMVDGGYCYVDKTVLSKGILDQPDNEINQTAQL